MGRRPPRVWLKRTALVVVLLLVFATGAPVTFIGVKCYQPGVVEPPRADDVRRLADGIPGYVRGKARTYLTLPEWYIVYSTEEYADFIRSNPPSTFPYFGAVRQYWQYYAAMCRETRGVYPFDPGVHLRLGMIGVGYTAENVVKGVYEGLFGRLSELISRELSQEDAFAARTAAEYGAFMHAMPSYDFPFGRRLGGLWRETSLWGPAPVRKWERKFALSAEYGVKAAYAWTMRMATGAAHAGEHPGSHARVAAAADTIFADPRIQKVRDLGGGSYVVVVPRHDAFTDVAVRLTRQGARFVDIAGNDRIVVSALAPRAWRLPSSSGAVIFQQSLLTDHTMTRVVVSSPVRSLHEVLPALERRGARLEHVYSY